MSLREVFFELENIRKGLSEASKLRSEWRAALIGPCGAKKSVAAFASEALNGIFETREYSMSQKSVIEDDAEDELRQGSVEIKSTVRFGCGIQAVSRHLSRVLSSPMIGAHPYESNWSNPIQRTLGDNTGDDTLNWKQELHDIQERVSSEGLTREQLGDEVSLLATLSAALRHAAYLQRRSPEATSSKLSKPSVGGDIQPPDESCIPKGLWGGTPSARGAQGRKKASDSIELDLATLVDDRPFPLPTSNVNSKSRYTSLKLPPYAPVAPPLSGRPGDSLEWGAYELEKIMTWLGGDTRAPHSVWERTLSGLEFHLNAALPGIEIYISTLRRISELGYSASKPHERTERRLELMKRTIESLKHQRLERDRIIADFRMRVATRRSDNALRRRLQ